MTNHNPTVVPALVQFSGHTESGAQAANGQNKDGHSSGSRGALGAWAPLAPKISSKSCSFQAILREKPYFEQSLGSGPPLGSKLHWAPLTKILDPRLVFRQNKALVMHEMHNEC